MLHLQICFSVALVQGKGTAGKSYLGIVNLIFLYFDAKEML